MNAGKLRKARPNYDFGDIDANDKPMYQDSQLAVQDHSCLKA